MLFKQTCLWIFNFKAWWWGYFTFYHFCLPVWSVCGKWNTHVFVYPSGQSVKTTVKELLYGQIIAQQLFFSLLLVFILGGKQIWNCFSTHMKIIKIQNFPGLHLYTLDSIGGLAAPPKIPPAALSPRFPRIFLSVNLFLPWTHLCF